MACIFSEIRDSEYNLKGFSTDKIGPLSMETIAGGGNGQIFILNFNGLLTSI
jgi:hypothetical protein